jgi:hypothetical protein
LLQEIAGCIHRTQAVIDMCVHVSRKINLFFQPTLAFGTGDMFVTEFMRPPPAHVVKSLEFRVSTSIRRYSVVTMGRSKGISKW